MVAAGTGSAGGLTALVIQKIRGQRPTKDNTSDVPAKEHDAEEDPQ